jgi:hypothetical protein
MWQKKVVTKLLPNIKIIWTTTNKQLHIPYAKRKWNWVDILEPLFWDNVLIHIVYNYVITKFNWLQFNHICRICSMLHLPLTFWLNYQLLSFSILQTTKSCHRFLFLFMYIDEIVIAKKKNTHIKVEELRSNSNHDVWFDNFDIFTNWVRINELFFFSIQF